MKRLGFTWNVKNQKKIFVIQTKLTPSTMPCVCKIVVCKKNKQTKSLNHTNTAWTHVFICAMKGVRLIGGETVFEFPEQSWGFWFGLAEPWVVCGAAYGPLISQSFHHTTHWGLSSYLHLLPFSCFTKHRKRKFQVAISWLRLRHYTMSRCVHRLFTINLCGNDWLDIIGEFSSFKSIWKTKVCTGSLKITRTTQGSSRLNAHKVWLVDQQRYIS